MTALQLPAHLQGRQASGVTARAAEGMGSSLPPHISIQGNKFTFVDASGNEAPPMLSFDGYVIDVSDHMNKRYYDKPFDQSATTYEPPACWSANGIAPSREATKPQATRCDLCPHNERGSAVSKMSGVAIKACRDERWLAVMNPAFGNMVFQLVVTPGSFKNWKGFVAQLENYKVDPGWVQTRFGFEDKTNGVLNFTLVNWTPPEVLAVIDAALAEKKTDAIVGRLDQPRQGALPGPANTAAALPPVQYAHDAPQQAVGYVPQGMQAPQPAFPTGVHGNGAVLQQEIIPPGAPQAPFGATAGGAGFAAPQTPPASTPATAEPAQPTQRRRRNSAAAAAPAQNPAPAAQQAPPPPFMPTQAPQAPFAQPAGPNASPTTHGAFTAAATAPPMAGPAGNNFGIQPGAPLANPEMSAMLANLFQKPANG